MAHCFFLSYARSDADAYFKRFRSELAEAVRVKVGGDLDSVAFVDRDDIHPGEEWPDSLASALQDSRVLVPVYSRSFFTSDYCGREWTVFRQRQEAAAAAGGARPPAIQPVLWVGKEDLPAPLPAAARNLQFDHASYGDDYAEVGLRQMILQGRYRDRRRAFIAALADRIVDVARDTPLPALPVKPTLATTPSAFVQEAPAPAAAGLALADVDGSTARGPRYVQFIFVAGTREELKALRQQVDAYGESDAEEWKPFHPSAGTPIGQVALEVASLERLWPEPVPLDGTLVERIEAAQADNKVVALIVDTWTLRLAHYHESMRDFDRRSFLNSVVLVPWNADDGETAGSRQALEDAMRVTFQNRSALKDPRAFIDTISTPADLRASLAAALAAARARVINAAEVRRRAESQKVFVKPIISALPGS